jgi:hypothetical protein
MSAMTRIEFKFCALFCLLFLGGCVVPPPQMEPLPVPSQAELVAAAQQIAALTMERKGVTYNLYDGDLAGRELYAVAISQAREEEVDDFPGPGKIHDYIQRNLSVLRSKTLHVGTWYNPSLARTYLEISTAVPDLEEAKNLARRCEQQAVYDLKEGKEIPVEFYPGNPG